MRINFRAIINYLSADTAKKLDPFGLLTGLADNLSLWQSLKTRSGLILFFSSFLIISGCAPLTLTGDVVDGYLWKETETENLRFEPLDSNSGSLSIQRARTFWLKKGEKINVKLDSFELHWEKEGEMCTFQNNIPTSDCQICNFCNPPADFDGPPCFGFEAGQGRGWPFEIVADFSFIKTEIMINKTQDTHVYTHR